jgi:microsomal dipeptidase-like Zn-dependent dipeptidase
MKNADYAMSKAVRVSIPASVAGEIGSLKKSLANILDKLGCAACCSGFDIFLQRQRDGLVRGNLRNAADVTSFASSRSGPGTLRVGVSPGTVAKLDDVFAAIDKIADLSGHTACATGCDIFLQMEEMYVINPAMQIEQVALRVGR